MSRVNIGLKQKILTETVEKIDFSGTLDEAKVYGYIDDVLLEHDERK